MYCHGNVTFGTCTFGSVLILDWTMETGEHIALTSVRDQSPGEVSHSTHPRVCRLFCATKASLSALVAAAGFILEH